MQFAIIILFTLMFILIAWLIQTILETNYNYKLSFEIYIIFELFGTIEIILIILTFDYQLFLQQLKSFEHWFRMYNIILFGICEIYLFEQSI